LYWREVEATETEGRDRIRLKKKGVHGDAESSWQGRTRVVTAFKKEPGRRGNKCVNKGNGYCSNLNRAEGAL